MTSTLTYYGTRFARVTVLLLLVVAMLGPVILVERDASAAVHDLVVEAVLKTDNASTVTRVAADEDLAIVGEVLPDSKIFLVEWRPMIGPPDLWEMATRLADRLASHDGVQWAVPHSTVVDGTRLYAWRLYAWPSGPQNGDGETTDLADVLDLDLVHQLATGRGVVVAVLDTGFDLDHPLLESRLLPGFDLIDGDSRVNDIKDAFDDDADGRIDEAHGHGTYVAGIVAQVAPSAKILPVRVLNADGVGEPYAVIEGIDFAIANEVDVINLSFGGNLLPAAVMAAVDRAVDAGIVVVGAAGNEGTKEKQYPAALDGVISVSAFDSTADEVAAFGTYGKWVDVAAPGVRIVSSKPGGLFGNWSGSSMAAPIVAGQAALLVERRVSLSSDEIAGLIVDGSSHVRGQDVGEIDILGSLDGR